MEDMLQAVVVVFMLFLCSLCLFAVIVIVRDIIHENGKIRRARDRAEIRERLDAVELAELISKVEESKKQESAVQTPAPAPAKEEAPKPEPVAEPTPVAEQAVIIDVPHIEEIAEPEVEAMESDEGVIRVGDDENAVVFSRRTVTLEEKYAALSSEFKRYFDEIIRHAKAKEGVREIKSANYYDYKNGSYKVLRINIKRGEIVCEFQFVDRDFLNYANASNVKMKQGATSVKVGDASAVGAVKDGIDLVCTQINEDREYKKNLANQKRREKRRKEREEGSGSAPALVGVGAEEK